MPNTPDFHDGERYGVTRNADDYAVIDRQTGAIITRTQSRTVAHRIATAENRHERAQGAS